MNNAIILTTDECTAVAEHMVDVYAEALDQKGPDEAWPASLGHDADDRTDETIVKTFVATLAELTPRKRAATISRTAKRGSYTELRALLVYSAIELAKREPHIALWVLAQASPTLVQEAKRRPGRSASPAGWDRFTAKVLFLNQNAARRAVEALAAAGYEFEYRRDEIDDGEPTVFGTVTGTTELDDMGQFTWLACLIRPFSGDIEGYHREEWGKQAPFGDAASNGRNGSQPGSEIATLGSLRSQRL